MIESRIGKKKLERREKRGFIYLGEFRGIYKLEQITWLM